MTINRDCIPIERVPFVLIIPQDPYFKKIICSTSGTIGFIVLTGENSRKTPPHTMSPFTTSPLGIYVAISICTVAKRKLESRWG